MRIVREGRVVKVVSPKLRKFRNNLRNIWLSLVVSQDNKMKIKLSSLQDLSGMGPIFKTKSHLKQFMEIRYTNIEAKRIANYSICLCSICLEYDRDMVWHQYSETWYCESCYNQLVTSEIPETLEKKVLQLNKTEKFDELYDLDNFIAKLPLIKFASLLLDLKINFIELLVKEAAKRKFSIWTDDAGVSLHEECELISQIISKQVVNIMRRMVKKEVESVLKLCLHRNIHFRDFIALPHDAKEFFFVTAHNYCIYYFTYDRRNFDWQLGQIKLLESGYIHQHIAKIVKKGEIEALRDLLDLDWLNLLNKSDFLSLMNTSEHGLYEILLEVNKDLDEEDYNIEPPSRFQKLSNQNLTEKIKKTIRKKDKKLIRALFRLNFFKKLSENDLSEITKDHDIVDIIYELRQESECYSRSSVRKSISEFFKKNKSLLRASAKQMVVDRLINGDYEKIVNAWDFDWFSYLPENDLRAPMKQMVLDSFMEGNHENIFAIWRFGWFSYLQKSDMYDLLEQKELHFLENLLLALYYYGYEGKDHEELWDEIYKFPFSTDFVLHRFKSGDTLRPQIFEIIKNVKKEAIIPLFTLGYITHLAFLYYSYEQNCIDEFWDEIYRAPFSNDPRFGKALRQQIVEVVENGKKEALVPLFALGYINLLEPKKIVSLFENQELKLFTKLYIAHKHNSWEFFYFNMKFRAWKSWFNAFLERIGIGKVFYDDDDDNYDDDDFKPTFRVNYDITIKKNITQRNKIKFLTKNIEQRILNKKEFSEEELKAFPKNVENIDSKSKNCQVEVILVESLDYYREIYEDSTQFGLYCLQYGISLIEHGNLVEAGETLNAVHGSEGWDTDWPFALFQKARIAAILGEIEYVIEFLERSLRAEFVLSEKTYFSDDIKEKVENSLEFQRYKSYIKQTLAHDYDNEEDKDKFWQGDY